MDNDKQWDYSILVRIPNDEGQILPTRRTLGAPLSDEKVLSQVTLYPADGVAVPKAIRDLAYSAGRVAKEKRKRLLYAVWPDGASGMLMFDKARKRPRDAQLLRAYRNSRIGMQDE